MPTPQYIDVPTYKLSHGGSIPAVGLGAPASPTWLDPRPVTPSTLKWLAGAKPLLFSRADQT